MFERFDDPGGFVPDDRFRAAVDRRGRQLRRRRRATHLGLAAVAVVVLAVGAVGLYVARRHAAIDRVDVATHPSTDGAVNILLLGDDGNGRADTIAVLRLDAIGNHLLSIPRDLVDAEGDRINAALAGGPQGMIDAVSRTLAIPIDHVVVLDFDGFAALVDAVGGLDVSVTTPVRDPSSGLALDPAACTTWDGATALAFVRARHLEHDPTGDLGRMARQQAVLAIAWDQLEAGPRGFDALSRVLADHAVVDAGLTLGRLVDLGRRLAGGPMLGAATLPVEPFQAAGGAAMLRLAPGSDAVRTEFGADFVARLAPSDLPPPTAVGEVPIAPCPDR